MSEDGKIVEPKELLLSAARLTDLAAARSDGHWADIVQLFSDQLMTLSRIIELTKGLTVPGNSDFVRWYDVDPNTGLTYGQEIVYARRKWKQEREEHSGRHKDRQPVRG